MGFRGSDLRSRGPTAEFVSTYLPWKGVGAPPPTPDFLWQMDESSGTRAAVRGEDLLATGTINAVTGKFGNAADFTDDTGDILQVSTQSYGANRSFSCWVYVGANEGVGTDHIMGSRDTGVGAASVFHVTRGTKTIGFLNGFLNLNSSNNYVENDWNHVVGVIEDAGGGFDRTVIYLNGVRTPHASLTTIDTTGPNFSVGRASNAVNALLGAVDQVAIWADPLTQAQVLGLFNNGDGVILA